MGDIADFRDPKVTWDGDHWLMTLACQQEIRFYASPNLKEWTYLSSFGEGYGAHGGVWECPELLHIGDKYVLLVSINPGGIFGGSATQYFVGDWDGKEFQCEKEKYANEKMVPWLDYGKDNYSTFTFHNSPDGRLVAMGWMSNWQYAEVVPTVAKASFVWVLYRLRSLWRFVARRPDTCRMPVSSNWSWTANRMRSSLSPTTKERKWS